MLSPNYTFLRSCPTGRFEDILLCFLEQFPVLFAKEGIVTHQELLSSTLKPRELSAQPPAASPQTLPDGASPHVHHVPLFVSNMEQICKASRKQSSLSGKESAQGCIPKRLLGRPDEALGGGNQGPNSQPGVS